MRKDDGNHYSSHCSNCPFKDIVHSQLLTLTLTQTQILIQAVFFSVKLEVENAFWIESFLKNRKSCSYLQGIEKPIVSDLLMFDLMQYCHSTFMR